MGKIRVLNTNVMIHNPACTFIFEDNDITTPIFFQLHNRQKLVTLQKYHHCQKLPVLKIHRPSKLKGAIQ
ncbi:MAG: hypothetical protein ACLPN1_08295 [Dissulfurispiraceae bacterium]